MSGIKDQSLARFYSKLHARRRKPRTVVQLAKRLIFSRTHLTEVINGTRDGRRTWPRLAKLLRAEELALLGRDKSGRIVAHADVPRGALSQMRQLEEVAS